MNPLQRMERLGNRLPDPASLHLIAMLLPYTVVLGVVWAMLLIIWI